MSARGAPAREEWISPSPGGPGSLKVAVAFPNSSWVAMSNLGYHAVLRVFLEDPAFSVARVFWEDGAPSFPDGGRSLREFDAVAVSVSHQPDLVGAARMIATLGPGGGQAPGPDGPVLIAGGAAFTINPEPAAPLFDLIVLGDGEPAFPGILDLLRGLASRPGGRGAREWFRERARRAADDLPGAYLPWLYGAEPAPGGGYLLPVDGQGRRPRVERGVLADLGDGPARPAGVSRDTEFGDLYLLEVSRGCGEGCLFCAAGALCRPVRHLPLARFRQEMARGLRHRKTFGLVGTAVGSHPHLAVMARELLAAGGGFSPSSLRSERMTDELAALLAESGHQTVSLAPEAGREELRRAAGKRITDDDLLRAAALLQDAGIPHLKLYFMVGLPGEEEQDAAAIAGLALRIHRVMLEKGRPKGRVGELTVNVTPFVPKPHTGWEREAMAPESVLKRRMALIRARLAKGGGIRIQLFSLRAAFLDALLSLADRRAAPHLAGLRPEGITPRQMARAWPGAEQMVFSPRRGDLPWEGLG